MGTTYTSSERETNSHDLARFAVEESTGPKAVDWSGDGDPIGDPEYGPGYDAIAASSLFRGVDASPSDLTLLGDEQCVNNVIIDSCLATRAVWDVPPEVAINSCLYHAHLDVSSDD